MTSEEERHEVAESIRYYAKESDKSAYEFIRGYWPNDLANLIDPTCKPVVDDVHGMDDELVCSECGCFLAIVVDGKPSEPLYRYCPNCGARIVREDEEDERNAKGHCL